MRARQMRRRRSDSGIDRPGRICLRPAHAGGFGVARLSCGTLGPVLVRVPWLDRKSTRLNSSHLVISYAVFCLKKKKRLSAPSAFQPSPTPPTHRTRPPQQVTPPILIPSKLYLTYPSCARLPSTVTRVALTLHV